MTNAKGTDITELDADYLRSVLDRYVGSQNDPLLRITFTNGEIYVIRYLAEVNEEAAGYEPDAAGIWSGDIVACENLAPERAKLFVPGSGCDFSGSEVYEIEDDVSGECLFTRESVRL